MPSTVLSLESLREPDAIAVASFEFSFKSDIKISRKMIMDEMEKDFSLTAYYAAKRIWERGLVNL